MYYLPAKFGDGTYSGFYSTVLKHTHARTRTRTHTHMYRAVKRPIHAGAYVGMRNKNDAVQYKYPLRNKGTIKK